MAEFRIREPKWNFPDGSELKEQKSGERERGRGAAGGMIFGNAQIPFFMWREHELCQGSESKGGDKGVNKFLWKSVESLWQRESSQREEINAR